MKYRNALVKFHLNFMSTDRIAMYLTVNGHALCAFFVVTTTILKCHPSFPELRRKIL